MSQAKVVVDEEKKGYPCPSCGDRPHIQCQLMTELGHEVWRGCKACWPLVASKHYVYLQSLCRQKDNKENLVAPPLTLR